MTTDRATALGCLKDRMSLASVPSLSKCYPDGTPYMRMSVVEQQIAAVVELSFDDLVARCAITNRSHPDFIRPECLIHMLRRTRFDNSDARFNRLFTLVLKRVALALPRSERVEGGKTLIDAAIADANEQALHRIQLLLTLDRSGGDRLDFYEVHFDEAVAMLRLKAQGSVGRRVKREAPLELDLETNELPVAVERAAGAFVEHDDAIFFDPIFRPRLLAAIDGLSPEQKEVVVMTMANIPIQSQDRDVPTISRILKCDPRTVQNRRTRAIKSLRAALGLGDDL